MMAFLFDIVCVWFKNFALWPEMFYDTDYLSADVCDESTIHLVLRPRGGQDVSLYSFEIF